MFHGCNRIALLTATSSCLLPSKMDFGDMKTDILREDFKFDFISLGRKTQE